MITHKIDPYHEEIIEFDSDCDQALLRLELKQLAANKMYTFEDFVFVAEGSEYEGTMPHPRIYQTPSLQKEESMSVCHGKPLDNDRAIGASIGKAMRHAERVSKREHIKADRIERVNQFIVSLRREFGYSDKASPIGNDLIGALCRKEIWHDIGVLTLNNSHVCHAKYSRDQIQKWVDEANKMKHGTEEACYQIEGDLEELERGLTGALVAVEDARKINQESEPIVTELCQLFQ